VLTIRHQFLMIDAWETLCEVSLLWLLFIRFMGVIWLLFVFTTNQFGLIVLYFGILNLHACELISCHFLFSQKSDSWSLLSAALQAWALLSLVVQHKYVVVIHSTSFHCILQMQLDVDLILPSLDFFWPLVWLLPSENSLFYLIKLIMSGDIDSTFKRLGEWYPQVIKVYSTFLWLI